MTKIKRRKLQTLSRREWEDEQRELRQYLLNDPVKN
jgi:hypothetical protein